MERFISLKDFGFRDLDFSRIPPVRLISLARHAGIISKQKIARMPFDKRIVILVAFVKAFEVMALDDAIDILDLLITEIAGNEKPDFTTTFFSILESHFHQKSRK